MMAEEQERKAQEKFEDDLKDAEKLIYERYEDATKQPFETVKQLTTLNAGSIVLIGTFLKDIFPEEETGALATNVGWLVAGSFTFFRLSLLFSGFNMYAFSAGETLFGMSPKERRYVEEETITRMHRADYLSDPEAKRAEVPCRSCRQEATTAGH
jgi:hypothetical protein